MRFKKNFLFNYVRNAPLALAMERSMECEIMSGQEFVRPILDIGCGDGLFAYILFDESLDVGIDLNHQELERTRELGIYGELIECDGSHIPKESGLFNTIFSNSVLEHIPDLQPVLTEAYRLLGSGGRFYVTIPTDKFDTYTVCYQLLSRLGLRAMAEAYRRFFNRFWKHFHFHAREDWEHIFERSGFEVLAVREYGSRATCLMEDTFVPWASFSFVTKKILNRWIMFHRLRKVYIYPLYLLVRCLIRRLEQGKGEGLLFFALRKK